VLAALRAPRPIGCQTPKVWRWQRPNGGRRRAHSVILTGGDWSRGKGRGMSASMRWLFHTRRTEEGAGAFTHLSLRLAKEEIGQGRCWDSSAAQGGAWAGLRQRWAWPLFVGFEALAQRQDELFGGVTPLHERTALVIFVGLGITDASRYQDAAAALQELRRMAPAQNGALVEVFTQRPREESKGSDFLYGASEFSVGRVWR
jgi:hypothetical protein